MNLRALREMPTIDESGAVSTGHGTPLLFVQALEAKNAPLLETAAAEEQHILENGKLKWQIITRGRGGAQNPRWVHQVRCCVQIVRSEVKWGRTTFEKHLLALPNSWRGESFLDLDVKRQFKR